MRDFLRQVSVLAAIGAGVALLLKLGELYLAFPPAVRMFGGAGLIVLAALLTSGASGSVMFDKARVRGIGESDLREHAATRHANRSAGAAQFVIGAVILLSQFFF